MSSSVCYIWRIIHLQLLRRRIGVSCFEGAGVEEVSVPDGVCELCESCFRWCKSLRRVIFGPSSSPVKWLVIPPSVKHLVDLIVRIGTGQLGVSIHIKPLMGPELKLCVQLTDTIEDLKARTSVASSQTSSV